MYGGTQLGGLDLICQGGIGVNAGPGGAGILIPVRGIDPAAFTVITPGCLWEIGLAPLGWGPGIGGAMGEEIPHLLPVLTYLANPGGPGLVPRFYTGAGNDRVRLALVGPDLVTPTPDPDFGIVLFFGIFYTPATAGPSFTIP